jgi:hypothetical protein
MRVGGEIAAQLARSLGLGYLALHLGWFAIWRSGMIEARRGLALVILAIGVVAWATIAALVNAGWRPALLARRIVQGIVGVLFGALVIVALEPVVAAVFGVLLPFWVAVGGASVGSLLWPACRMLGQPENVLARVCVPITSAAGAIAATFFLAVEVPSMGAEWLESYGLLLTFGLPLLMAGSLAACWRTSG